jgi:hypothetical protein
MAITRAQQAKQMLQDGGRIGLQGGGADSGGKKSPGGGDYKSPSSSRRGMSPGRSMAQFGHSGHAGKSERKAKEDQRRGIGVSDDAPSSAQNPYAGHSPKEIPAADKNRDGKIGPIERFNQYQAKKLTPFRKNTLRNLMDYIGSGRKFGIPAKSIFTDLTGKGLNMAEEDYLGLENVSPIQLQAMFGTGPNSPVGTMDEEKIRNISKVLGQDVVTQDEFEQFYPNMNLPQETSGDDTPMDPCLGPNPPAYCFVNQDPTTPETSTPTRNLAGLTPRIGGSLYDFDEFAADGGRIGAMGGGIMNVEDLDREAFLLGGLAKGLKKAVRGIKKLAKSPIGKAALFAAGAGYAGFGPMKGLFSGVKGAGFLKSMAVNKSLLGTADYMGGPTGILDLIKANPKTSIFLASLAAGAMTPKEDKDKFDIDAYYAKNQLNPSQSVRGMGSEFDFYGGQFVADGGRIGYDEAGAVMSKEDMEKMAKSPLYKGFKTMYGVDPEMAKGNKAYEGKFEQFEQLFKKGYQEGGDVEPVAKKTMPLIDMDGKEKDYRETGGFVDMGRMERADDVPARLSKNEFVFTADAVRNAGEGDIDKGAEVMYNMMKNLEAGGEVSEESQGLEGAREMFQTSQRLGEVI